MTSKHQNEKKKTLIKTAALICLQLHINEWSVEDLNEN